MLAQVLRQLLFLGADAVWIKKDFPFPESLMELLYMDTQELEAITKKMDKALLAFYQSGAKDDLQVVAAGLDELASRHVYFELLRLDWTERLMAAERVTPGCCPIKKSATFTATSIPCSDRSSV